jgi:hypothetical protein
VDTRSRHRRGARSQTPSFPPPPQRCFLAPHFLAPRCASDPYRASFPRQATLLRRAGGAGCTLSAALDDAACAALPIATAVTMLYYALLTANPGFVEEPCVPFWLRVESTALLGLRVF